MRPSRKFQRLMMLGFVILSVVANAEGELHDEDPLPPVTEAETRAQELEPTPVTTTPTKPAPKPFWTDTEKNCPDRKSGSSLEQWRAEAIQKVVGGNYGDVRDWVKKCFT